MLVLTRKVNEGVMIGDEIEIRVSRIDGDFVKIGIQAPRNLTIYRNEVYKQMKEANLRAARSAPVELPKLDPGMLGAETAGRNGAGEPSRPPRIQRQG